MNQESATAKNLPARLTSVPKDTPVMHLFLETHMALAHRGLTEMAKAARIDVTKLRAQEYLVFVNGPVTAAKVFTANNTFAYYRMHGSTQLTIEALEMIPTAFGGRRIRYTEKQKREIITAIRSVNEA